jgi:predicted transcriptional regulator
MERKSLTDLREEMRAVARGDSAAPPRPTPITPFRMISTEGVLDLLGMLAKTPVPTVSRLAQQLGKDQSEVSRTLQRLACFGIVRLQRDGLEVRPELVSVELKLNLVNRTIEAVLPLESAASAHE